MSSMFKVASQGRNSIVYFNFSSYTNFNTVKKKAQQAKSRNFRRIGAIVRGIMRRSIRHRKNPNLASPIGTPPYAHFLPGVKNTIEFVATDKNVMIGPQIRRDKPNIKPVPGALEYGGYTMVKTFRKKPKKTRRRAKKGGQFVNGKYHKAGTFLPHASGSGKPVPNWYKKKNPLMPHSKVRRWIRPRPFANPAMHIFLNSPQYEALWKDSIK